MTFNFVNRKKMQRNCKMMLIEDKILIKTLQQKVVWYEQIACIMQSSQVTSATHNCEASAADDR